MKFRTSRETLLRPLRVVTGVVERRQTLPVLSNLLVEASEGGLMLRGTDLEVEVVAELKEGVDIADPGAATIPAHKLAEIWQSLPESVPVDVALENDRAVIRCGRGRFVLATIPVEGFPTDRPLQDHGARTQGDENEAQIVLSHADVHRLLNRTKFAMANQDVRYFLNGLLLELTTHNLRVAASDGHRMAMCTLEGGVPGTEGMRVIVPRKSIQYLERLISDSEEDVRFVIGRTYLRATQGEYTLTTKLVDGQFPDVDRLIPSDLDHSLTGDRETLRQALNRAAILSNEKTSDVRLQVEDEQLTIRATNPEQEEAEEVVAVDYDGSTGMDIGFNVRYIQDVLNALDTESVKVSMPEGNSIALIEGPGAEDSLYLVMPLRR